MLLSSYLIQPSAATSPSFSDLLLSTSCGFRLPLVCRCRCCGHAAVCPLVIQLRFYCCRLFFFWLLYLRDAISASSLFSSCALAQVSAQTLIGEPSPVVAAHTWPLCPRAAERLGGARKPHAVVLLPFETCTRACVATLCTCSSEFTPDLAQAHASLSCPPARALEPTALAKASSQPLIG